MKITEHLVEEHRQLRRAMTDLRLLLGRTPMPIETWERLRALRENLVAHAAVEERHLYSALQNAGGANRGPVPPAYLQTLDDEHNWVSRLTNRLESDVKNAASPAERVWVFHRFCMAMNAHMEREEEEVFPFLEQTLGADFLIRLFRKIRLR